MTRKARFTAADVTRAVRACQSAGMEVRAVAIRPDGTIEVVAGEEAQPATGDWRVGSPLYSDNPLDRHLFGDQRKRRAK